MKTRRFFFHYNKPARKMSVHFKKKCYIVDDIECTRFCETKHNMRQPHIVMQGFALNVIIKGNGVGRLKAVIL